jgi:hypothetical protein
MLCTSVSGGRNKHRQDILRNKVMVKITAPEVCSGTLWTSEVGGGAGQPGLGRGTGLVWRVVWLCAGRDWQRKRVAISWKPLQAR